MPTPPDVRLFSLTAYNRQCVADDTDYYLVYANPDPGAVLDRCIHRGVGASTPRARLRETGLRCEEDFLRWRAAEPRASMAATRMTYDCLAGQIEEFLPRIAVDLVGLGHYALTDRAIRRAERELGYLSSLAVLKRAASRCWHDSKGYDAERLREMCDISNEAFVEPEIDEKPQIDSLRRILGAAGRNGLPEGWDRRTARDYIRRAAEKDRRAVKRSIRVAERFVGTEPTRLFISGKAIRITGRYATFELTRGDDLMRDHGGAQLSVYTREGDIFLCNLCLYTAGVPILDHVVSIFLHIRAGEEEALLDRGNPYDVAPEAKEQEWLAPHLARRQVPERAVDERDGRDLPSRRLVRDLAGHLFEEIGDLCPPMPETRAMLENGYTQADVRYVPIGTALEGDILRVDGLQPELCIPLIAS